MTFFPCFDILSDSSIPIFLWLGNWTRDSFIGSTFEARLRHRYCLTIELTERMVSMYILLTRCRLNALKWFDPKVIYQGLFILDAVCCRIFYPTPLRFCSRLGLAGTNLFTPLIWHLLGSLSWLKLSRINDGRKNTAKITLIQSNSNALKTTSVRLDLHLASGAFIAPRTVWPDGANF